jgi:hypothetical protein
METVGLVALIAIIWKVVDFCKFITNRDGNAAITQASVWLSAVAVALLAREAEPFSTIGVVGTTFGELSWPAIILFALGLGSTASGVVDFKKAFDQTGSATAPPLLPPRQPVT